MHSANRINKTNLSEEACLDNAMPSQPEALGLNAFMGSLATQCAPIRTAESPGSSAKMGTSIKTNAAYSIKAAKR